MIGKTLGHYHVAAKLGEGGMGEVYRARDEHLDRDVALKVLPAGTLGDESARRRFRREAEALSRLNHPHIATVYDFDSTDGIDFLVMEYVPGQTLSQRIAGRPLPEKEIATLGSEVAAALEEAHERGVVHRDLKPANIIVSPKGRVKVLDFGLAQLSGTVADLEQTTTRSESGFGGTLPYMAPEQVRGEAIDARTDIYALGVVLYEMATGERPFNEPHTGRLTDAILHAPVTPPTQLLPRVNPELERIILKCLERDPESRYQSAKEVAIDLRRLGSPSTAHQTSAATRRKGSRTPIAMGLGLAAVALQGLSSALSLASMQEAARLDPLYRYPPLNASQMLVHLNRPEEALAYADNVLRLEPDMPYALTRKGLALIELGRAADLAALIPTLQRQLAEGRAEPNFVSLVNDGAALIGGNAAAQRAALDRLEQQALNLTNPFVTDYPPVLAWLVRHGRTAGALAALERRAEQGRIPYDFLRLSPDFKALATNERFVRALGVARAQFDDTVAILEAADARSELPAFMRQPLVDLLRTLAIKQQRASLH